MAAILTILLIAAIAWFWSDSLRARERVTRICARACSRLDVQFLDETVALRKLGLARDDTGWLRLRRLYAFEFSTAGNDRWEGRAVLLGHRLDSLMLEHPQGITILGGSRPVSYDALPFRRDLQKPQGPENRLH